MKAAWTAVAWLASRPRIATWLIARSKRTPYYPITSRDGAELYMDRHWLFNAYGKGPNDETLAPRWPRLPSIRVHHILRADDDAHLHDHPWDARTIVLRGWYREERPVDHADWGALKPSLWLIGKFLDWREIFHRSAGYTGPVLHGQYHRIAAVSTGGVYTLWFTWRYRGVWGFLVDGAKVPWREYLESKAKP